MPDAPKEVKPSQPEAKQEAAKPAPKPHTDKPHHLKVTQMSLREVEEALEGTRQSMGGTHSQYARALLARKEYLSRSHFHAQPKAA